MSTKSTIAYGDNFRLYEEIFEGGVYLEVENTENAGFKVIDGRVFVNVQLPKALLDRLQLDNKQLVEPTSTFSEEPISNIIPHAKK